MTMEDNRPHIIAFGDLIEANTIRENNAAKQHTHKIGDIVEVDLDIEQPGTEEGIEVNLKGTCRLFVVGHIRDCDGTPLYCISDIPVKYPLEALTFAQERLMYSHMSKVMESGYPEERLRSTGASKALHETMRAWLWPEDGKVMVP